MKSNVEVEHVYIGYWTRSLWCLQVRCDSGIQEGSEISVYYDPMICKVSLEKRGKKPTSLNFFSSRTVYITIQTHSLRHGHCIVKPLYLRHDWIKKNSRYQRIWDIEFKIRTGNCGTSNLLNRHIHGICPCLKYQIWTVHVSPQNKAVLHVL